MSSIQTCPICHEATWSRTAFDLFKCVRCSMLVGPQLWRLSDLADANEAHEHEFVGKVDRWQALFETIRNRRVWRRIRHKAAPGGSLLEIGVGSGSFLAHARTAGLDVLGCELSPAICGYVTRRHDVEVMQGDVRSIPATSRFDIVVMTHVLEHVPDPVQTLVHLRGVMHRSSVLYIAVPNAACWEARLPGWVGYQSYHLSYFTSDSLLRALRAAGFSVASLETVEPFSGWAIALRRSLLGSSTASPKDPRASASGAGRHIQCAMAGGIGLATAPLRYLQGRLGFGEELIAVAVPA